MQNAEWWFEVLNLNKRVFENSCSAKGLIQNKKKNPRDQYNYVNHQLNHDISYVINYIILIFFFPLCLVLLTRFPRYVIEIVFAILFYLGTTNKHLGL